MTTTTNDSFWREYTSQDAIRNYSRTTAGYGISYLLDHDYKAVYLEAARYLPSVVRQKGLRVLEFGCGTGMNLLHLVPVLRGEGTNVTTAIGTDFSPVLIGAAKREARSHLQENGSCGVEFYVARNERLVIDLSESARIERSNLENSFHFILGVNTIRYCHAAKKEMDNARGVFNLLVPGGICVVVDMNNRFPFFRSYLRNRFRRHEEEECYVPSLEEYAAPFVKVGFELLRKEHFCWVPHSSGRLVCGLFSAMSPLLNIAAKSRAMRSLVVARKPH